MVGQAAYFNGSTYMDVGQHPSLEPVDRFTLMAWIRPAAGIAADAGLLVHCNETAAAWRLLIKENHPDKLVAEGLPQDFIDMATSKMATINNAWGTIQKQRGLK